MGLTLLGGLAASARPTAAANMLNRLFESLPIRLRLRLPGTKPPEPGMTETSARDPFVDFIRGLALLIIFIDHNTFSKFRNFTLHFFTCIDAAEVFIFISGYVCGMVYSKVLAADGFVACQKKALSRFLKLYLAQFALVATCLLIMWTAAAHGIVLNEKDMYALQHEGLETALGVVSMTYVTFFVDLLPLYAAFILITPAVLILGRRRNGPILCLSVLLYIAVQWYPTLSPSSFPTGVPWPMNPLAWQLLYVVGLCLGQAKTRTVFCDWRPRRIVVTSALCTLGVLSLLRVVCDPKVASFLHLHFIQQVVPLGLPLRDKVNMGPVRLVYALLLLIILWQFRPTGKFLERLWARGIVACGRRSLAVYSAGVVLNYLGLVAAGSLHFGQAAAGLVSLGGFATLVLFGIYLA